ncbi:hypothetical protein X975_06656, partial [Stegodyphus mimosarum]
MNAFVDFRGSGIFERQNFHFKNTNEHGNVKALYCASETTPNFSQTSLKLTMKPVPEVKADPLPHTHT